MRFTDIITDSCYSCEMFAGGLEGFGLAHLRKVGVDAHGHHNVRMTHPDLRGFHVHTGIKKHGTECVPLGYNNDKTGNPYGTRVLSDSGC